MKVVLEPFACACVEDRFGSDLATGTQAAVRHYARRIRSKRQPVAVPSFRRRGAPDVAAAAEFELSVSPSIEAILKREARRQGVPVERIVAHAVFVYFADLDAPAAGERLEEHAISPRYRLDACHHPQRAFSRRRRAAGPSPALSPRRWGRGVRGRSRFGKR